MTFQVKRRTGPTMGRFKEDFVFTLTVRILRTVEEIKVVKHGVCGGRSAVTPDHSRICG